MLRELFVEEHARFLVEHPIAAQHDRPDGVAKAGRWVDLFE